MFLLPLLSLIYYVSPLFFPFFSFLFPFSSFFRDLYSFFSASTSSQFILSFFQLLAFSKKIACSSSLHTFFLILLYSHFLFPPFCKKIVLPSLLLPSFLPPPFIFPVSRDHLSPNFSFSPSPRYLDKTSFFFLSYNFPPLLFYLSSLLLS